MNKANNLERYESFLGQLESSLSVREPRKREILDEIRSDLMSQVSAFQEAGKSETEALDLALDSMGNPHELARKVSEVVPPLSTGPIRVIRYLAAAGMIAWTLLLLWTFRAWTYGFSPAITAGTIAFHLSLILVIWPGIIWRKNWLFGLMPAGISLFLVLVIQVAGISQQSKSVILEVSPDGQLQAPATPDPAETPEPGLSPLVGYPVLFGLLAATGLLFYLMQRTRQRRVAMATALLVFLVVEGSFFVDEIRFRKERDRLLELVEKPTPGEDDGLDESSLAKRPGIRIYLSPERDEFSLHWTRPLANGFSLCYSSADDRTWVND